MQNNQIEFSVIGAGRFGTFWGRQLSQFFPVFFYDQDESRQKLIEPFGKWDSLENCLKKDYIFLTIPIRRLENFLKTNAASLVPGTVIIDCASVKGVVLNWFKKFIPSNVYYLATHPLFGPDSAQNSLEGHTITIVPGQIPYYQFQFLVNLFSKNLHLDVLNLSPDEHDRLMAYNLSLIHHLGRTLHDMEISKLPLMMAGLAQMNRITQVVMNDSEELFDDFHRYNPYANDIKEKFLESFHRTAPQTETLKKLNRVVA